MGDRRVVDPVRGCGTCLGLVGLGAGGPRPLSGEGNGFATRYAEDFALLAGLGLTHHRLSMEWARLEPEPGRPRPGRCPALPGRARRRPRRRRLALGEPPPLHAAPVVRWRRVASWSSPTGPRPGARHVDFVAETFGDLVAGWQPVNETNYYARAAYGGGDGPPATTTAPRWRWSTRRSTWPTPRPPCGWRQTGAPVSSIFGLSPIVAQDDDPATASMAQSLFDYHWAPWVGLFRDGVLRVPGRGPVERPDLAGFVDMIGFSYYATMGVRAGQAERPPADAPLSPLGYGIWADGLGLVLDRIHDELPGTPVLVAEYGIGTDDDAVRADYLARGLRHRARGHRPGHRRTRPVPLDGGG